MNIQFVCCRECAHYEIQLSGALKELEVQRQSNLLADDQRLKQSEEFRALQDKLQAAQVT